MECRYDLSKLLRSVIDVCFRYFSQVNLINMDGWLNIMIFIKSMAKAQEQESNSLIGVADRKLKLCSEAQVMVLDVTTLDSVVIEPII